jgi:two-component system sensor histidine kinase KdpD
VALKGLERELTNHKVEVRVASGLPLVRMDFVLMEQAIANLVLNAAVHTRPGCEILIDSLTQEGELVIRVSDNGPGIPGELIERIFDKFYRLPGTPAGGSGLGLSIVKGFVEGQGGRVHAANREKGGAVFTIVLPCEVQPEVPAELP